MKTKTLAVGLFGMLTLAAGCGREDLRNTGGAGEVAAEATRPATHTFDFEMAGIKASSRVDRQIAASGAEVLNGHTSVLLAGAAHPFVLEETAHIDASGRLVLATAELRSGARAGELVRSVRIDAVTGHISVRDARGARSWRAPADEPWVYEGLLVDIAPAMADATAVQAWVARRAAHASSRLRDIHIADGAARLTLADQVALPDEGSEWIVLGDEAIETDADFVRALPWRSLAAAGADIQAAEQCCAPGPV